MEKYTNVDLTMKYEIQETVKIYLSILSSVIFLNTNTHKVFPNTKTNYKFIMKMMCRITSYSFKL